MLFTSYEFLIFLFALILLYYLIPKKYQWMLLLAASYVFYGAGGPKSLLFVIITTVSTYAVTLGIGRMAEEQEAYIKAHKSEMTKEQRKAYKAGVKKRQRRLLLFGMLLNFGILAVLKYTNFAIYNVNQVLHLFGSSELTFVNLLLPMGISFYTFQTMSYLIDVYRGKYPPQKNLGRLALFVSFFPQMVQGPISRYDDLSKTMYEEHPFDKRNVSFGMERILWGYFKKLVVADRILPAVTAIIQNPGEYQGFYVFLGMMFYAVELYADFTGGIDITIGIAQVFGIKMKENFIRPYFSKNITEYWRRWHISMGTWFTEYIFYPISVSQPMLHFSKFARSHFGEHIGKRAPVYLSSAAVWFTTGIWHGASWNFIVWGMMNFLVIMVSQECEPLYQKFHARFHVGHTQWYRLFQVVRTVLLMSALRMLDCYRDVPLTFRMFGNMLTASRPGQLADGRIWTLGLTGADFLVLFAALCVMIGVSLAGRSGSVREKVAAKPAPVRFALWYGLFLAVLIFGAYGVGYDSSQFIYNQF